MMKFGRLERHNLHNVYVYFFIFYGLILVILQLSLPWVTEAFLARFPVEACVLYFERQAVAIWPPKLGTLYFAISELFSRPRTRLCTQ